MEEVLHLGFFCFQTVVKKPAGKVEEERTGPIFILIPNGKEQRIKEEKSLKVCFICLDY